MKTLFPIFQLFLLVFFFVFSLNAQFIEDWTEPIVLTDSLSFNSNPVVAVFPNSNPELYMFYEKDGQIWWRKMSEPMSEEQMLIGGWPEVVYRNPQILQNNFLIFECNVFENYDLFGVKIDENGLAGDFFQLTNTEYDENSFYVNNDYYSIMCCWESEGNIYVAETQMSQDTLIFVEKELIDSGDCFDPNCRLNYVVWRKVENNESHIYYSKKTYPLYQWTEPVTIIDTGNNINHSISLTALEFFWGDNSLCWQAENKIYLSDIDGGYITSPEIPGIESYYEPESINVLLFTDYGPDLYTFAGETESDRDIYFMGDYASVLNLTNDPHVNKNPRLFIGRNEMDNYEVINIWQTEINGYDVLFSSIAWYQLVFGRINDNEISQLNVFPNPFTETLNIELINDQTEVATLEIFSISGERLFHKGIQGQPNSKQSISWAPTNEGLNLSEGIYLVKLTQGISSVVQKVVYSK